MMKGSFTPNEEYNTALQMKDERELPQEWLGAWNHMIH